MSARDTACIDDLLLLAGKNPQLQTVLLVRREVQAQLAYRCRKYQIYVLSLPLRTQILTEMLRMCLTMRSRLMEKEEELQRMRKKTNEMSIVTKAKCLLIQMRQMTEEEAHYYLEKKAMDEGLSKREVAMGIINMYS
jgi:response regulator NasT